MGKNISDEEWDKLLEEQFLKEADFIEEALFSGDDWDDDEEETEEEVHAAYEELVARLRARGEYREEAENDMEAEHKEKVPVNVEFASELTDDACTEREVDAENVIPMVERKNRGKSSYKVARVAGFAVVGVLCVFAASMTSEANRKYFINNVRYLTGIDTRMVVDNDEKNEYISADEYAARNEINDKLGIDIPEFFYRPHKLTFCSYEINNVAKYAYLEYEYGDTIITLYCQKKDEIKGSINFSLHGEKKNVAVLEIGENAVDVFEVKSINDILPSYVAQWKREDVTYQLGGKIEKEEFLKIIEKIRFLP